jgi:hypothetical protein
MHPQLTVWHWNISSGFAIGASLASFGCLNRNLKQAGKNARVDELLKSPNSDGFVKSGSGESLILSRRGVGVFPSKLDNGTEGIAVGKKLNAANPVLTGLGNMRNNAFYTDCPVFKGDGDLFDALSNEKTDRLIIEHDADTVVADIADLKQFSLELNSSRFNYLRPRVFSMVAGNRHWRTSVLAVVLG